MSLLTLPVLFFDMGGEMLYILDQRLRAQKVPQTKAVKVMRDIAGQMFEERCVKELFRPQKVFTKRSLRTVFDRLAHASIMKLNSSAMDKLYDLMLMAVKHQVLLCKRGEDVILVTLNHLDTVRELVGDSDKHISMLNAACKTVTDFYSRLTAADFIQLRCTLLTVFQDTHKRVSVFLKTNAQLPNGHFVIPTGGPVPNGFEVPGTIRYFGVNGEPKRESHFTPLHKYDLPEAPGSWEVKGNRVTSLGLNIYASDTSNEPPNVSSERSPQTPEDNLGEKEDSSSSEDGVVAELHLLERLLVGFKQHPPEGDTFRLKLFPESDDEDECKQPKSSSNVMHQVQEINPSKKGNMELSRIMQDFTLEESVQGSALEDDLLELMDTATQ